MVFWPLFERFFLFLSLFGPNWSLGFFLGFGAEVLGPLTVKILYIGFWFLHDRSGFGRIGIVDQEQ